MLHANTKNKEKKKKLLKTNIEIDYQNVFGKFNEFRKRTFCVKTPSRHLFKLFHYEKPRKKKKKKTAKQCSFLFCTLKYSRDLNTCEHTYVEVTLSVFLFF